MLLAGTSAPFAGPSDIRGQLVASDIPWPTIKLSTGEEIRLDDQGYTLHRDAPNRADRKTVFDTFWKEYGQFHKLWFCEFCLQFFGYESELNRHLVRCVLLSHDCVCGR